MTKSGVVVLVPPLKWAGGKRWLVPELQQLWAPYAHRRLVEPFVGGMAVALGLTPGSALLNDVNRHLINFYRWLQRGLIVEMAMVNDKDTYYGHRQRFNDLIRQGQVDGREAAWLFYYLNRTGFNGLCRFNGKGFFNVPFGRYETINYRTDFGAYSSTLSRWRITHGDFEEIELHPGDFVYADPPYDVPFTSYSKGGFSWVDQVRLARWLSQHKGPVVTSNQATERIVKLYRACGFEIRLLDAPRRISCTGDRSPAKEILATRGM